MKQMDQVVAELKEKRNMALQWEWKNKFQEVMKELNDYHNQKKKEEELDRQQDEFNNSWYGYFMSFIY
jgi:hypothetical protein